MLTFLLLNASVSSLWLGAISISGEWYESDESKESGLLSWCGGFLECLALSMELVSALHKRSLSFLVV